MTSYSESSTVAVIGNHWFPTHPGGLDRYVYELVNSLADLQTEVDLFGVGLPLASANSSVKLTNLARPNDSLWQRLWRGNQVFRVHRNGLKPDAVNIHFALYGLPLLPYLPSNVPVVCTFHGPWAQESQQEGHNILSVFFKKQIEKLVYHRCDRFIVLSKAFGEILHQEYRIPWSKIHVIPGGVDTERFQPNLTRQQAREKLDFPRDRFILFAPRRLVQRMGIDQLLVALAQVKQINPNVWLAIAGKGPLRNVLEHKVRELELEDSVKFLGFLPDEDLPIAYQAADLTVIPSQALEGFGLVLLESLACGTPALCTPVGGMPEVVNRFSPELITETSHADSIARTLESVMTGGIQLPGRDACREYAATHFSWDKIAQQVWKVLLL